MVVARENRLWVASGSCLVLALAGACAFDASGNSRGLGALEPADEDPDDDGDDDGADDDGDEPEPEPEPEPGDDGATRTDDGASADDDGGNEAGTDDGDEGSVLETGADDDGDPTEGGDVDDGGSTDDGAGEADADADDGADMCPVDVLDLHWAESAAIADPMVLLPAEGAMSDPEVAVSDVAEEGTATFPLHFDCGGQYYVWALVWDYYPGAYATEDPDSFYVGIGGPEPTWRYGCQTGDVDSGLSWQKLEALTAQPCDVEPIMIDVVDGTDIELTFRNREEGWSSQVAGVAAIVISNDPDADPYSLYDPY